VLVVLLRARASGDALTPHALQLDGDIRLTVLRDEAPRPKFAPATEAVVTLNPTWNFPEFGAKARIDGDALAH
jgi:hypothetical protein